MFEHTTTPQAAPGTAPDGTPDANPDQSSGEFLSWKRHLKPLGVLAALTLLMFIDVLIRPHRLLSQIGTDLSGQFIPWLEFGFGQLRHGHLPLWNPYIYGGMPYVGGFQSAMFYPFNWIHLILPVVPAVNLLIALHTFLSGAFMYFWASRRGLNPLASVISGALLMFCGAGFLHIYAGHLPNLYSMPWAPLLFLVVDELAGKALAKRDLAKWCLVGAGALAMQILAGHPQYVFYTGISVVVYAAFRLWKAPSRLQLMAGLGIAYIGGVALSAVQFLTGMAASSQGVRSVGIPFEFASLFSFAPENFLTILAPGFFGDMIATPYWGRCYLWEMSLFIGVSSLVLAIYGAIEGEKRQRRSIAIVIAILLLLALGSHTPLLEVLFHHVPGFNQFRGSAKFIWQASAFLALLAGVGLHRLSSDERRHRGLGIGLMLAAAAIAVIALLLRTHGSGASLWLDFSGMAFYSDESYMTQTLMADPTFGTRMTAQASSALFIAAGTLALAGFLIQWNPKRRAWILGALAVAEVFVFARHSRASLDTNQLRSPQRQAFFQSHPGDYRVLNLQDPNSALSTRVPDLWGNDPGVSLRYAQFMAYTQGEPIESATQYQAFKKIHRLYRMLRLQYLFAGGQIAKVFPEYDEAIPQAFLVHQAIVAPEKSELLKAMGAPTFDPEWQVALESQPNPAPEPLPAGEVKDAVRIVDRSTDHFTLDVEATTPAILVLTEGFDKDWRARALAGSSQTSYQVLPANYILRGIPIAAGHHKIRLEYAPKAFRIGAWITVISLLAYVAVAVWICKRPRPTKAAPSSI
ncbi:MAG TPA: hypothetical protein PKL14_08835 [Holophaga sp.]|nr:hypothetical protein [Holophaga sp.]